MNSEKCSLSELAILITKGTTPSTLGFKFTADGIPFLRAQNLQDGEVDFGVDPLYISPHTHSELSRSQILPGDILLSIAGTIGRPALVDERAPEMNCNQAVAIIRPSERIFAKYLLHWLTSSFALAQIRKSQVKGTITNLSLGQIANLSISLPPLDEQQQIAAILDQADELRRKRQEALRRIDELYASLFSDLFGNLETNNRNWPKECLSRVVRNGTIVTYGIVQAGEEVEGGVPYIRTGDIVGGEIATEGLRHTGPDIAAKFMRSRVEANEIVMSIRATVGTTAFVPPELDGANLTQGTARIAPGDRADRHYLLFYLRSDFSQRWIERQVKGATFREITLSRLRELPVLLPPLDLQRAFAACVAEIDKLKAQHRGHLQKLDALFASLQYRAFRGEL